jgi:predicted nucleotidyltransferase
VIVIPDDDPVAIDSWRVMIQLGEKVPKGWTLVGAQMVALHAYEHNEQPPRLSPDFDVVANVRLIQDQTRRIARVLEDEIHFRLVAPDDQGVAHRFARGQLSIDLLAADNLGEHADLTTIPTARTIQVPGSTQALRRTELVEIEVDGTTGLVPRPNLLGAIIIKCRAIDVDDAPNNQRLDFAFLMSLVRNPRAYQEGITSGDRRYLRGKAALFEPDHPIWVGFEHEAADRAQRAFAVFTS